MHILNAILGHHFLFQAYKSPNQEHNLSNFFNEMQTMDRDRELTSKVIESANDKTKPANEASMCVPTVINPTIPITTAESIVNCEASHRSTFVFLN